jgi:hypothetical protein
MGKKDESLSTSCNFGEIYDGLSELSTDGSRDAINRYEEN